MIVLILTDEEYTMWNGFNIDVARREDVDKLYDEIIEWRKAVIDSSICAVDLYEFFNKTVFIYGEHGKSDIMMSSRIYNIWRAVITGNYDSLLTHTMTLIDKVLSILAMYGYNMLLPFC